jgi:isopentenyldiphosphate isomerase
MENGTVAHPENSPQEMVEEVDAAGNVLRLVSRREMRAEGLRHRSVFVAVMSESGQLLVHRRAETKDVWPGWWDLAVGGVLSPSLEPLGTGAYSDATVSLLAGCFVCRTEGPFTFADGEITEAHWVSQEELPVWLGAKPFLPDSVALVLPRLWRE